MSIIMVNLKMQVRIYASIDEVDLSGSGNHFSTIFLALYSQKVVTRAQKVNLSYMRYAVQQHYII